MDKDLQDIIDYQKHYGNDNIFYKEIIKNKIIGNEKILKSLNNEDLDIESPDDFIGVCIFPFYLLPMTQTDVKSYICFETSFTEVARYNTLFKMGQIIFYVLCDNKDAYEPKTGIARHDLIAALLTDEFNYCHDFGQQIKLVSDKPYAVDNNYTLRTLIFEQETPNNIVEAQRQRVINNTR